MTDNKFSWNRVGMVARYYYPMLRSQIIWYPIVALAIQTLVFFSYFSAAWTVIGSLLTTITSAMIAFGPLIFTNRSNRVLETMLPATSAEKSVFIIGYCLVAIPLLVLVVAWIDLTVLKAIFGEPEFLSMTSRLADVHGLEPYLQTFQQLIPLSTCMFCVAAMKTRLKTIGFTILSLFILGVAGAVFGVWIALTGCFNEIAAGNSVEPDIIADNIISSLSGLLWIIAILSIVYTIIMATLTARRIVHKQI